MNTYHHISNKFLYYAVSEVITELIFYAILLLQVVISVTRIKIPLFPVKKESMTWMSQSPEISKHVNREILREANTTTINNYKGGNI